MHCRLSLPEEGSVVVVPLQAEVVPAHPHDPSGVTTCSRLLVSNLDTSAVWVGKLLSFFFGCVHNPALPLMCMICDESAGMREILKFKIKKFLMKNDKYQYQNKFISEDFKNS